MKKLFLSLLIGASLALAPFGANAELTRQEVGKRTSTVKPAERTVHRLSDEIMLTARKRGIQPQGATDSNLKTIAKKAKTPSPRAARAEAPRKAASLGSAFYGYRIYTAPISGGLGWVKVEIPDAKLLWSSIENIQGNGGGFIRDGKVYNFFYEFSEGELIDCGLLLCDFESGRPENDSYYSFFDWLDADALKKVVYRAVYDEENDEVYVVTSNAKGNADILQKFDPVTMQFTDLGVSVPTDWVSFAWHPVDKTIYMFDNGNNILKYDFRTKKFVETGAAFSYTTSGYDIAAMTYSPKDQAFYTAIDTYYINGAGYDEDATDIILVKDNGAVTYLGTLSSNDQYTMLYCPDSYVNPGAPVAPTLNSVNITGEATSGTISITLPKTLGDGTAISKQVYVKMEIDGTAVSSGSVASGQPGATVTVNVSTNEGLHRINLTPYLLTDDGFLYGQPLVFNQFFGHDTPAAPSNVTLEKGKVTWSPVTKGANGGYIVAANVKYEVSIDGVVMTPVPISGTAFTFDNFPPTAAVGHTASVVAIENGKRSEAGVSGKYYQDDDAFNVPCFFGLEDGAEDMDQAVIEMFTTVRDPLNLEPLRGWRYDDQALHTGGFYCLSAMQGCTTDPDANDEYLFLPAINFTDADKYYRLTMDVWTADHYFTKDETYEIVIAPAPGRRGATVIRPASVVHKKPDFETSETLFKVPSEGEWYIGIHYITNPALAYRLYARNFLIEETNSTDASPAAVDDLMAVGSEEGALSAEVTFTMPTTNVVGNALAAGTVITATVSTTAGSVEVTGAPGAKCNATVPALQGTNVVQVTTSVNGTVGLLAETTVYVGVYRPGEPIVDYRIASNNSTISFEIELDPYNEEGQWVGADDCDVTVFRKIGNTWREVANIGKGRTWAFEIDPTSSMDIYDFGFAAKNVVGSSEYMNNISVVLGKPYTLPMSEDFTGKDLKYEPISIEHLSYLPATWGFADPTEFDETASIPTNTCLIATWESDTQASLPKFSTKGCNNVKAELEIFFGDKMPKLIRVFASTEDLTYEPVASFNRQSGEGWQKMLIDLPAAFQNKGWVELKIRVQLEGYSSYFMLGSYAVADYPAEMVTISSVKGETRAVVGETKTISIELQNAGTSAVALPSYEFKLIGDKGVIGTLEAVDAPARLEAYKKATLNFEYTPKVADQGNVLARFTIAGQPAPAVTEAEHQIMVLSAPLPVVDDLKATVSDDKISVTLDWTDAVYAESFEGAETWSYGEKIREFINIDNDGSNVWGITQFNYPGKGIAKGYQVFSSQVSATAGLTAHTGDHYLMAMSTTSGVTDDWLISPEIKGGSTVSFWLSVLDADYPETIYVMYSTTGTALTDFEMVDSDDAYICPDRIGWNEYSVELPANAKYFALWHYGDNGYEQFGCVIDDIKYEAANPTAVKESYNVYRNGELVATVTETSYVDTGISLTDPIRYYVTTQGKVNGETAESDRSNVVWVEDPSMAVDDAVAAAGTIEGAAGKVVFAGFEDGETARLYTADGVEIANATVKGVTSIDVIAGIYLAKCGEVVAKVVVR